MVAEVKFCAVIQPQLGLVGILHLYFSHCHILDIFIWYCFDLGLVCLVRIVEFQVPSSYVGDGGIIGCRQNDITFPSVD